MIVNKKVLYQFPCIWYFKKNMTSTVDDFCETRQIVMFWNRCCSLEGSHLKSPPSPLPPKKIPLQHWCNEVNTFWPPSFHIVSPSLSLSLAVPHSFYSGLAQMNYKTFLFIHFSHMSFSNFIFPWFPPLFHPFENANVTSNCLKNKIGPSSGAEKCCQATICSHTPSSPVLHWNYWHLIGMLTNSSKTLS